LEDLLSGIHGCWLIYQEYVEPSGSSDEQGDVDGLIGCASSAGLWLRSLLMQAARTVGAVQDCGGSLT